MKPQVLLALMAPLFAVSACSTTTEAVSLPFDFASTTGDAASSTSSGDDSSSYAQINQQRFVASQLDWIARDAARGEGESLAALAQLLNEPDPQAFAQWTQQNYALLFEDLHSPQQLLSRIARHRSAQL